MSHPQSPPPHARDLGEVIRELTNASARIGHGFASRQGLHDNDFRALTLIYSAENAGTPLTPSELARQLRLSSAAITYLVERLVGSGHARRDSDPRDRRKVVLRYAPHGHATAGAFFGPLGAHLGRALAEHEPGDVEAALRVLRDVVASMHAYGDELEVRDTALDSKKGPDRDDRNPSVSYTARDSNPEPAD
ncbi:MarR family winged helix-turn-helix transcriptional regulator [Mariniluteicoccus flavus]